MAVFVVGLLLLSALAGHSDATYCVCNSGMSDSALQKNIDYACGAGADCSAISQNGPCFNPNTVRDHCNYAVNSYYQRKGQIPGSCDFQGTATVTPNPPNAGTGCVYQSSPSSTPSTPGGTPTAGGTPTTGGTPVTGGPPITGGTPVAGGTPNTGGTPVTGGVPNTGGTPITGVTPITGGTPVTGGGTNPGVVPMSPDLGLGPSGSGFGSTDNSASRRLLSQSSMFMLVVFFLNLLHAYMN